MVAESVLHEILAKTQKLSNQCFADGQLLNIVPLLNLFPLGSVINSTAKRMAGELV